MKKRLTALLLALVLALCVTPVQAASDSVYLEKLTPAISKDPNSYPARLEVSVGDLHTVLEGTCGLSHFSDECMLDILKRAVKNTKYKDLDEVLQDTETASAANDRLRIRDEQAAEQIIKNLEKLAGVDEVVELAQKKLNGTLSVGDVIDFLNPFAFAAKIGDIETKKDLYYTGKDAVGGLKFASMLIHLFDDEDDASVLEKLDEAVPDHVQAIFGVVLRGVEISFAEYERDQQKWADIAARAKANARLRHYYAAVAQFMREERGKNGIWSIRIDDRKTVMAPYDPFYDAEVPHIFIADIELVKQNKSADYTNISGAYSGRFLLRQEIDMKEYDSRRHVLYCDSMNREMRKVGAPFIPFEPVSIRINKPAENYFNLESGNISVEMHLPYGKNRERFEFQLDAFAMEQTEFSNVCDYVMVVKQNGNNILITRTITEFSETSSNYRSEQWVAVTPAGTDTRSDDDWTPLLTDVRPYVKLTLVVDML